MIRYFYLILLGTVLFLSGCSPVDHSSQKKLADSLVTALAENDPDSFWQTFSPELQKKIIESANGDEDKAKEELFAAFLTGLKEKYQVDEPEKLPENKQLFRKIVGDLISDGENKFVKIEDEWYINTVF